MSTKACIAWSEEIEADALLCEHCGTKQDDSTFTEAIDVSSDVDSPAAAHPPTPGRRLSRPMLIRIAIGALALAGTRGALAYTMLTPEPEDSPLAMPGVGQQVARVALAEGMCPNGTPERTVSKKRNPLLAFLPQKPD